MAAGSRLRAGGLIGLRATDSADEAHVMRLEVYGLVRVKLYEDAARHVRIATAHAYPVKVESRHVMDLLPIPKFDNPKMDDSPALQLFGAGREPGRAEYCRVPRQIRTPRRRRLSVTPSSCR